MDLAKNKNTSVEELVNQPFFNDLGQIFQESSRTKKTQNPTTFLFGGWVDSIDSPIPHSIKCSSRASDTQLLYLEDGFPPKKRPISIPSQILEYPYKKIIFPKGLYSFFPTCRITTSTARASEWISTHFWDIQNGVGYVSIVYIYICQGLGWSSHPY